MKYVIIALLLATVATSTMAERYYDNYSPAYSWIMDFESFAPEGSYEEYE